MIKLMIPDMPTAEELLPYLQRIDAAAIYSNRGPLVNELEADLTRMIGAPCVTASSCTTALELALRSLQLPRGSLVAVPAFTFAATGRAVESAGLQLALCNVDPTTWALHPGLVPHGVRAVVPVAPFGAPIEHEEWARFSVVRGIPVIIDAAGGLLAQDVCSRVDAVYSLHATKFVGAGEGGVFASTNPARVEAVRNLTMFGDGGTNAKMSEYHAAVALAAMQPSRIHRKQRETMRVVQHYRSHCLMRARVDSTIGALLLPEGARARIVVGKLHEAGIEAKQWYRPFLDEDDFPTAGPATDQLRQRLIGLPFHTRLTNAEIDTVCEELKKALA